jgi:2-phosphosulfolactate phosphatase
VRVSVAFTPSEAPDAPVAVAIDVLRASATICAALAAGFGSVACVSEIEDALALRGGDVLLAGERDCVRIDGFDLGNSPAEMLAEPRAGRLALSTTNGTRLLVAAAARSDLVLVGSLANLSAIVTEVTRREPGHVAILCAGVEGAFALDDAYCAGRLVQALGGEWSDSAVAAATIARNFPDALTRSSSAANLRRAGLADDVAWCAVESRLDIVPAVAARQPRLVQVATLPPEPGA